MQFISCFSTKFGDYIRSLEHDEWLMVLEAVFCDVLQILKNMKVRNIFLLLMVSGLRPLSSPSEVDQMGSRNSFGLGKVSPRSGSAVLRKLNIIHEKGP